MEKTVNRLVNARKKLQISNQLVRGADGAEVLNHIMNKGDFQKQGGTQYPGQQFGFTQAEVKGMLQNGIKSMGFVANCGSSGTYTQQINLTGEANLMLGFALAFPDTFQQYGDYPTTFNFKVNNETIITDVHPMFYDVTAIYEPYFEYVYLLAGRDLIQVFGNNSATAQTMQIIVYYI